MELMTREQRITLGRNQGRIVAEQTRYSDEQRAATIRKLNKNSDTGRPARADFLDREHRIFDHYLDEAARLGYNNHFTEEQVAAASAFRRAYFATDEA